MQNEPANPNNSERNEPVETSKSTTSRQSKEPNYVAGAMHGFAILVTGAYIATHLEMLNDGGGELLKIAIGFLVFNVLYGLYRFRGGKWNIGYSGLSLSTICVILSILIIVMWIKG